MSKAVVFPLGSLRGPPDRVSPEPNATVLADTEVTPLVLNELAVPVTASFVKKTPTTWRPLGDLIDNQGFDTPSIDQRNDERDQALGVLFRQAYDEGIRRGQKTVNAIMDRYHDALAQIDILREQIMTDSEENLATLALFLAQELVGSDNAARELFTFRMVEESLQLLRESDTINLRLSPADLASIHQKRPDLLEGHGALQIVEDTTLNLGGVIADSELGRVDASMQTRLQSIALQLREQLSNNSSSHNLAEDTDHSASSSEVL